MSDFGSVLRRTFIAIATDEFEAYESLDVASEVSVVRGWLCDRHLDDRRFSDAELALRPTESTIKKSLAGRRFTAADALVVYVTGHGQTADGAHYTVLRKSDPARLASTAVETVLLLKWITDHRDLRHVLIIIDLCEAGDVLEQMPAALRRIIPKDWVAWLTTSPGRKAKVGAFTGVLRDVLRELRSGSDRDATDLQQYLESHVVFGLLKQKLEQDHKQELVPLTDPYRVSCCLPNPKYDPARHERVETAPERQDLAILRSDMETHWATRAPVSQTSLGAVFTGRRKLVTKLIQFLQGPPDVLVVSGRVGSGKSAALVRVVTCSDPLFRARNSPLLRAVEPVPPEGIVDVAVLATGKSSEQIAAQIAAAFGTSGADLRELIRQINVACALAEGPPRIVIDALDEASDPVGVVHTLLRQLPIGAIRLVVGVRSSGGDTESGSELADVLTKALKAQRIAADGDEYWESDDLIDYVGQILRAGTSDDVTAVAEAVEGAAARSYLVAQLMAGQLAEQSSLRADDPQTRTLLASGVTELLERDLEASLPDSQERAVARLLLRASALAFGRGISWRDVWPAAATAIAGDRVIGDGDIERLLRHRLAGYLVRDVEDDVTVYRPFHDALRASLSGSDSAAAHRAIARRLRTLITTDRQVPPPSYVRRHLASHAAEGGVLDGTVLTAETLPFLDSRRLSFELRLTEAPHGSVLWTLLSAWRGVRHRWSWRDPRANAAALDLALVMSDSFPPARSLSSQPGWRPLWAEWAWGGTIVASTENHDPRLAVGEVQGRVVFAITDLHEVRLVEAATGDQVGAPLEAFGQVNAVAMAGSVVAAAVGGGRIHVWEAATGRLLRTWETLAGNPRAVSLAEVRGRMLLAFPTYPEALEVWEVMTGSQVLRVGSSQIVRTIAIQPSIAAIAVSGSDGVVEQWDLDTGASRGASIDCEGEVNRCVWGSVDGRLVLVTAEGQGIAQVWDAESGEHTGAEMPHQEEVRAVAFTEDQGEPLVATGSFDKTVGVWGLRAGARLRDVLPHPAGVTDVAFGTIDGRLMVATACRDGNVRVWDPDRPSGARVAVRTRVGGVALRDTAQGLLLATGDERGVVSVRRAVTGEEITSITLERPWSRRRAVKRAHEPSPVVRLGDQVLATYYEGVVQVRALSDLDQVIREFPDTRGWGFVGGDRIAVLTGSSPDTTKIVDVESGKELGSTRRSIEYAGSTCWVPGGRLLPMDKIALRDGSHLVLSEGLLTTGLMDGRTVLAEWQDDDQVSLWNVEWASPITVAGEHRAIAVAELNGDPVVVTAHHATIRVWSARTGRQIAELPFGTPIEAMAVEQVDGGLLVAVSGPGVAVTRLVEV